MRVLRGGVRSRCLDPHFDAVLSDKIVGSFLRACDIEGAMVQECENVKLPDPSIEMLGLKLSDEPQFRIWVDPPKLPKLVSMRLVRTRLDQDLKLG